MNWLTGPGADDRHARLTGTALLIVALGLTAWIFYLGPALPNQGQRRTGAQAGPASVPGS
jgi:hypothetical protein